jgi:D-3-phosphoglycerate dehydrogenase
MAISYPKNRINVLLAGKIPAATEYIFQNEGYNVQRLDKNFSDEMLFSHLNRTSILSIGPDVRLPENWLQQAPRLMAVGAFSKIIPTDPQDCLDKGIAIFQENSIKWQSIV